MSVFTPVANQEYTFLAKAQCTVLMRNLTKVWKTWMGLRGVVEHGLEVPNLHCLKSYKIRNTIINFQKLNSKNEVYLTLKSKSLCS